MQSAHSSQVTGASRSVLHFYRRATFWLLSVVVPILMLMHMLVGVWRVRQPPRLARKLKRRVPLPHRTHTQLESADRTFLEGAYKRASAASSSPSSPASPAASCSRSHSPANCSFLPSPYDNQLAASHLSSCVVQGAPSSPIERAGGNERLSSGRLITPIAALYLSQTLTQMRVCHPKETGARACVTQLDCQARA